MALARRLARHPLLTTLLVIGIVNAAPASLDAPAASSTPAPATTVDIPVIDDSLTGFVNENSSTSERVVGRGTRRPGDELVGVSLRGDERLPSVKSIASARRGERNSHAMTWNSREGSDVNIGAHAPYWPSPLLYNSPATPPHIVGLVPYSLSPLGYEAEPYSALSGGPTFRQAPSFPFQVQWPLASYFPVLIKDPFLTFLHGGNWNNLVEYGQAADVCTHRRFRKSPRLRLRSFDEEEEPTLKSRKLSLTSRRGRSLVKRAVSQKTPLLFNSLAAVVQGEKKIKKKKQKIKPVLSEEHEPNEKNVATESEKNGDLRFPLGGFDWFGNKKPVAPSPGFFINRLKVHRGGVAIAGPGGVATAGRGGTAVVGPGGMAYTQPGGLAVAGPHSRVLALSSDADLDALAERVRARLASGAPPAPDPQAALVATGPVVYYHNESRSSA